MWQSVYIVHLIKLVLAYPLIYVNPVFPCLSSYAVFYCMYVCLYAIIDNSMWMPMLNYSWINNKPKLGLGFKPKICVYLHSQYCRLGWLWPKAKKSCQDTWDPSMNSIRQNGGINVMVHTFTSNSENLVLLNVNVLRKLWKINSM